MSGPWTSPPPTQPPLVSGLLRSWPLGQPAELAALRRAALTAARAWRDGQGSEHDAGADQVLALVISELATNALKYGTDSRTVTVTLYRAGDDWLVDVTDANAHTPPAQHPPDGGRAGRNGLLIIDRTTTAWGWYRDPDDAGLKHVWATVPDPSSSA